GGYSYSDFGRSGQSGHLFTQIVSAETETARPNYSAGGVGQKKWGPTHGVRSSKKGSQHAQNCNKSAKEHHFSAVPKKQVLPELNARLCDTKISPVLYEPPKSHLTAYPKPNNVSNDRPKGRDRNHDPDIEHIRRGSDQCGDD